MNPTDKKYSRKDGAARSHGTNRNDDKNTDQNSLSATRPAESGRYSGAGRRSEGSQSETPRHRTDYSRGRLPSGAEPRSDQGDRRPSGDRDRNNRDSRPERGFSGDRRPSGDRDRNNRDSRPERGFSGDRRPSGDRDRNNRDSRPERGFSGDRRPSGDRDRNNRDSRPEHGFSGDRRPSGDRDRNNRDSRPERGFSGDRRPSGDRDRNNRDSRPERGFSGDRRPSGDRDRNNRDSRPERGFSGDRRPSGDRDRNNRDSRPERGFSGDRRPSGDRDRNNRDSRPERGFSGDRRPFGDRDRNNRDSRPERGFSGDRRPFGDRDRNNRDSRPERGFSGDRRPFGDRDRNNRDSRPEHGFSGDRRPSGDRDRNNRDSRPEHGFSGDRRPSGDRDRNNRDSRPEHGFSGDRRPFGDRDRNNRDSRPEHGFSGDRRPSGDRDRNNRDSRPEHGFSGDRNARSDRPSYFEQEREEPIVATWEDDDLADLQALPFRAAGQSKERAAARDSEAPHRGRSEKSESASEDSGFHNGEPVAFLPGVKPVLELLESAPERVDTVYLRKGRHGKEMDRILDICRAGGIRFSLLEKEAFGRVYQGRCQGVAARLYEAGFVEVDDLLQSVMDAPLPLIVVLDQVQDPGNAGTLARTLYCFGGAGMIVPRHNGVYLGAAAAKASAGALEKLPVARAGNLGQAVDSAKKLGFTIYGAASPGTGESIPECPIFSLEARLPALLILGSEESGLRPMMEKRCDILLSIPMLREFNSLNVAQAGAVLLGQFLRLTIKQ